MAEFTIRNNTLELYDGMGGEVFVPEGVTVIAERAFQETAELIRTFCKRGALKGKRITTVHLPQSVRRIDERAFEHCVELAEINLPEELESVGEGAFHGCSALKEIRFTSKATQLGDDVFYDCTALEKVTLPSALQRISPYLFAACSALRKLTIPKTVESIDISAFSSGNISLSVAAGNPHYLSKDGVLFADDGKTLLYVPAKKGNAYVVPDHVENIEGAFRYNFALRDITLHNGIRKISDKAFMQEDKYSFGLHHIRVPADARAESIGKNAFGFRNGSDALLYPTLPVDYVPEEALRRRLALAYCSLPSMYEEPYASGYLAYVKAHVAELRRLLLKQKERDEKAMALLDAIEAEAPSNMPVNYSKLKPIEKVELLEKTVLQGDAAQVTEVMKNCKTFEFTARALGMACRYASLEVVKVLVENGASFEYEEKSLFKSRYGAAIKTRYSETLHWASYELLLVWTEKNPTIPTINAPAFDVHFGMLPPIKQKENEAGERAKIAEYLLQKGLIDATHILIYALLWGNLSVAKQLFESGAAINATVPGVQIMLDGSMSTNLRSELMATLPLLKENICAFALEKLGEAAEQAGYKLVLPQKLFESKKTPFLTSKVLAQVVRFANVKKLSKTAILEAVTRNNDIEALDVLVKAGWMSKKTQMDQLIRLAGEESCPEAAAWVLNYMNQNVNIAKETEKEEKKVMRELNASPLSLAAMKKLWLFKKLANGMLEITDYKGDALEVEVPATIGKDAVYSIGESAFSAFTRKSTVKNKDSRARIEKIVVPEGVVEIGAHAFAGCTSLREIQLPSTLRRFNMGMGTYDTFGGCSSLEKINLPDEVEATSIFMFTNCDKLWNDEGLLLIDHHLIAYAGKEEKLVVPEGVVEIADYALNTAYHVRGTECASELVEIQLPESLRRIGGYAFGNQTKLNKLILPQNLQTIGSSAFEMCYLLKEISIPDQVSVLEYGVFSRCSHLSHVKLPAGLKEIAGEAFERCKELKQLDIPKVVEVIGHKAFAGSGMETLFLPENVKELSSYALYDMLSLKDLWLPDSICELNPTFLSGPNADEVRIHIIPNSKLTEKIGYRNIVHDYPV